MRPGAAKKLNADGDPSGAPTPPPSSGRNSRELLFDSEAILRLVDGALTDLRAREPARDAHGQDADNSAASAPPQTISSVITQISESVDRLLMDVRSARNELPARRLQNLYGDARLEELSSAAAMVDRLGSALVLVDALESGSRTAGQGSDPLGQLRHELFSVMNCLQFHSDTVERLNRASALLAHTESRLAEISGLFEPLRQKRPHFAALPDRTAAGGDGVLDPIVRKSTDP